MLGEGSGPAAMTVGPQEQVQDSSGLTFVRDSLARATTDALLGVVDLEESLTDMLSVASREVSRHPDLDYEDTNGVAYRIAGLPEGMEGHIVVGLEPYSLEGRTYRHVKMNVDLPGTEPSFHEGVFRGVPNVNLSISYDVEEPNRAVRFALMLQQRVLLNGSLKQGIDAYHGTYTSGSYYWIDLEAPLEEPFQSTIGIVDGRPAPLETFPGISPLTGNVRLDRELLHQLLAQFQRHLSTIGGHRK